MKPLVECRLYAFIDTAYLRGRKAGEVARQLCAGGADLIQLRAKDRPAEDILELGREILAVTAASGAGLVINDYPAVAIQLGAPCVHLGQEDFFETGLTRAAATGNGALQLGLSTHSPDQAARAMASGADYIAIGPVFPTPTKSAAKPVTLSYVRWAAAHVTVPWFAIGGINLENVESVLAAGARRICVVSAILNAPDVVKACQDFRQALLSVAI